MRQGRPSLARVVEVLAGAGETSFSCEDGVDVDITITRAYYLSLYGLAPRRAVAAGMRLTTEHVVDGHYCRLELVVERAVFDTPGTARVQLEAVELVGEPLPDVPEPLRPHLRLVAA